MNTIKSDPPEPFDFPEFHAEIEQLEKDAAADLDALGKIINDPATWAGFTELLSELESWAGKMS